jgi:uncharacterized protein (DUF1330 family)
MKIINTTACVIAKGGSDCVGTNALRAATFMELCAKISVTDPEGFAKEFSPLARKALAEAPGYRALVLGGKTVAIEGPAPKTRVVINVFDNLDAAVQAYNSPDFKAAKKIGDKYATFRTYAVEGR